MTIMKVEIFTDFKNPKHNSKTIWRELYKKREKGTVQEEREIQFNFLSKPKKINIF